MNKPIYLDYMATTPVDPRVIKKMWPYLENFFGNPASKHFYGCQTKTAIEEARNQVASLINCNPKNIIWTSGATEANNLAIKGAVLFYKRQGKHIVTCQTEHKSVLDTCKFLETQQGFDITYLAPESDGLIDLEKLKKALRQDTILLSIMHVNNEIGVIQDIANISEITHSRGILFHVDSAQGAGKIPINLQKLKIDLMSFSAHKVYGPKGVGALYIRSNPQLHLVPQIHGGSQENNLRAGTLAPHQIVGMGEAFHIAQQEIATESKRLLSLRERFVYGIKNLGDIYINGSLKNRIPGNLNLSFAKVKGEILLAALKDLAISTTSACIKDNSEPSYVLWAIGVPDQLITSSFRLSIGRFTTIKEIDFAIKHISEVVTKLRKEIP
ncbi:MAG: IscS subfamily cysteine desulfurase [Coxiellaceae bacterium]|jgi:cysteine desulfurase|nr:IscS subfamily cysteine desulfurase [Coxiellaceae bacterium]